MNWSTPSYLCGYKVVFFCMEGCFIVYNVTAYAVATSSVLHILYCVPLITSQQADASFMCMHILHVLQDVSPHGIWMLVDLKMLIIASGKFPRYVCGQHHSLIMCTPKVITYQGFL